MVLVLSGCLLQALPNGVCTTKSDLLQLGLLQLRLIDGLLAIIDLNLWDNRLGSIKKQCACNFH